MSILFSNLGTSDIAVKIEGYYIPLGFDRDEPNLVNPDTGSIEDTVWRDRQNKISTLAQELGISSEHPYFPFRELSAKLLEAYENDPISWHPRIIPGRIWGIIEAALAERFNLKEIHLIYTNQPETELKGRQTDTIFLYKLLKAWFHRQYPSIFSRDNPQVQITGREINFSAIDLNQLFEYYYNLFQNLHPEQILLINLKGGTPQMGTALRIQANSAQISRQLFLEPKLVLSDLVNGKYSECEFKSYWRYLRSQRYQAIRSILEKHWEFDGAIQMLQDWLNILTFLDSYISDTALKVDKIKIATIIKTLKIGQNCLNLDLKTVHKLFDDNQNLEFSPQLQKYTCNNYSTALNLYTQCRICWNLNRIVDFLPRMASLYEEILVQTVLALKGEKYFVLEDGNIGRWRLKVRSFPRNLTSVFKELIARDRRNTGIIQLVNRDDKQKIITELVKHRNYKHEQENWTMLKELLRHLEFWVKMRNNLVHGAEGISKPRMEAMYQELEKREKKQTCSPSQILPTLTNLLLSPMELVCEDYRDRFVGLDKEHYIYSETKNWAIQQLFAEFKHLL
jgi:hypothetical protein